MRSHLPAPIVNGGGDSLWKWPNFRLWRLVTLTLNLDGVFLHTVMHHSSTSTYIPNFIEIEETFCGRTYGRAEGHLRPTLLCRLGGVDLKIWWNLGMWCLRYASEQTHKQTYRHADRNTSLIYRGEVISHIRRKRPGNQTEMLKNSLSERFRNY